MEIVALIPARAGSKRLPGKNTLLLKGVPLIAWTIIPAKGSKLFKDIVVSSDSELTLQIAREYGGDKTITIQTPPNHPIIHQDHSNDYPWIEHALYNLKQQGKVYDAFCILRPTNPFRTRRMLEVAITQFRDLLKTNPNKDYSLRAVEPCHQHPYKMWKLVGDKIIPYAGDIKDQLFTQPYQSLPTVFEQNASLEISFADTVFNKKSHTENNIYPFYTQGLEGFDIHTAEDFRYAEYLSGEMIRNV